MKRLTLIIAAITLSASSIFAQVDLGADFVSRYIWRGSEIGGGAPAAQPWLEYSTESGFAIGAWGSYSTVPVAGRVALEADLYAFYEFDFGLGLILTDYYIPTVGATIGKRYDYFLLDGTTPHVFELGASYGITEELSLAAYYNLNAGNEMYLEAAYSFQSFDLIVGAGDGFYTANGAFNVCNIGISSSKDITITDSFSLPVFGQFVVNPSMESVHLVFGLRL